jgi:hypothetical protein
MWISILITLLTTIVLPYSMYGLTEMWWRTALIIGFVVIFGVGLEYEHTRNSHYAAVIESFRKAVQSYQRLINPTNDHHAGPKELINGTMAQQEDKSQQTLWHTLAERTFAIHQIVTELLQDCVDDAGRSYSSIPATKGPMKRLNDRFWRMAHWYHSNVIEVSLRLREEVAPQDKSLRRSFSLFRKRYHEVLEEIKRAREGANAELGFNLIIDVGSLELPEIVD